MRFVSCRLRKRFRNKAVCLPAQGNIALEGTRCLTSLWNCSTIALSCAHRSSVPIHRCNCVNENCVPPSSIEKYTTILTDPTIAPCSRRLHLDVQLRLNRCSPLPHRMLLSLPLSMSSSSSASSNSRYNKVGWSMQDRTTNSCSLLLNASSKAQTGNCILPVLFILICTL